MLGVPKREGWCGRGDLNPHAFRRHPLKMVCLPVPPLPRGNSDYCPEGAGAGVCGAPGGVLALGASSGFSTVTVAFVPGNPGTSTWTPEVPAGDGAGVPGVAAAGAAGAGAFSSPLSTESPLTVARLAMIDNAIEVTINAAASPMVALDKKVAVPGGPNAA